MTTSKLFIALCASAGLCMAGATHAATGSRDAMCLRRSRTKRPL